MTFQVAALYVETNGARGGGKDSAPRIGTPAPFRELLLSIAATAKQQARAA